MCYFDFWTFLAVQNLSHLTILDFPDIQILIVSSALHNEWMKNIILQFYSGDLNNRHIGFLYLDYLLFLCPVSITTRYLNIVSFSDRHSNNKQKVLVIQMVVWIINRLTSGQYSVLWILEESAIWIPTVLKDFPGKTNVLGKCHMFGFQVYSIQMVLNTWNRNIRLFSHFFVRLLYCSKYIIW